MKIPMLSAFAATENNTWHFARRELMQQAAGGRHLLISEAQIASQVFLPNSYAHECNLPHSHFVRQDGQSLGVALPHPPDKERMALRLIKAVDINHGFAFGNE
jgi:hypothetical protein